jgi:serine phosphatase RsbU (regulator of sigma subunit)
MALVEQFAASLTEADAGAAGDVRAYLDWLGEQQPGRFDPGDADDVHVRDYLLHLRVRGANRLTLKRVTSALRRFYGWLATEGFSGSNPFDEYNFDRPYISRAHIRRRESALGATPEARELALLRALSRLAEALNRTPDVATTLKIAMQTLLDVMGLHTAWVFLRRGSGLTAYLPQDRPPALHDFELAAAAGLPPGLEQDQGYFLRNPPDCHCQWALRSGHLRRAVNVVECTRILDAAAAKGDTGGLLYHATVPLVVSGQPVGQINVATGDWQFLSAADLQLLTAVGAQVSAALERAKLYDLAETQRARLEQELRMARDVQQSLLPNPLPKPPGYQLAAEWRSALEMAGDFFDVFDLPDGGWRLVMADVSDKGAPAAMYMAMVHSLLRSNADRAAGPADLLIAVNRALCRQSFADMFVTVFYAVLNPATGALTWCSAGHNPPLVRGPDGRVTALPRGGLVLGIQPSVSLADQVLDLPPGAILVAYTDGLTDSLNPAGEDYGLDRLKQAVAAGPPQADALAGYLHADLAAFTGSAAQPDDITFMILARDTAAPN